MSRPLRCATLAFASVLALGGVALADSLSFGSASAPTATFGAVTGSSYSQPGFSPWTATGAVAGWDSSTASFAAGYGVKGTYALGGTDDFLTRTASVPTLSYPFWIVGKFRVTTASGSQTAIEVTNSDGSQRFAVLTNAASVLFYAASGGSASASATTATASGTWTTFVAVGTSATSRAIYTNLNTTGGTNASSLTPSGMDRIFSGCSVGLVNDFAGDIGPISIYSGTGPDSTQRGRIFAGDDPDGIATTNGCTLLAGWGLDNALTDRSGNGYTLTASGDSVTAQNKILCLRDRVSNTYHLLATTSAPIYYSSAFSGRGGMVAQVAGSQFLRCPTTPITAAPFQVYLGASSDDAGTLYRPFSITDTASLNEGWILGFAGATGGDPVTWTGVAGGSGAVASTSTGFVLGTPYLLWGQETSSSARAVELNGAGQGTNSTTKVPTSVDAITLGAWAASSVENPHNGGIAFAVLLNTAATTQQADFEAWSTAQIGAP